MRRPERTDQPIRPRRSPIARCAQLAPVVAQAFDVGDLVVLVGLPQPVEPLIARAVVDRCRGDDLRAGLDREIDGGADGA
jgi:hypothetical protein